jgi:hypothetical protein
MENSFFIFSDNETPIRIERFHICTWEFKNDTSLIEFGCEIFRDCLTADQLSISLFIPWLTEDLETGDLYNKLSIPENSRFIFNDSINGTDSLDGGLNRLGVIHRFTNRDPLCILPISIKATAQVLKVIINLQPYQQSSAEPKPNIYFRFWIRPKLAHISMRKKGVNKSTVIYDIKINERRNIPSSELAYFADKSFCTIDHCFLFNIIPNKYEIVFIDNSSLKNVRTLEYNSFERYLGDRRVKNDELIVFFNKKQHSDSFSFFSIYSKERIGTGQFALAILANIFSGFLLFIPGYRKAQTPPIPLISIWKHLPIEVFAAFTIAIITLLYFIWPPIAASVMSLIIRIRRKIKWGQK